MSDKDEKLTDEDKKLFDSLVSNWINKQSKGDKKSYEYYTKKVGIFSESDKLRILQTAKWEGIEEWARANGSKDDSIDSIRVQWNTDAKARASFERMCLTSDGLLKMEDGVLKKTFDAELTLVEVLLQKSWTQLMSDKKKNAGGKVDLNDEQLRKLNFDMFQDPDVRKIVSNHILKRYETAMNPKRVDEQRKLMLNIPSELLGDFRNTVSVQRDDMAQALPGKVTKNSTKLDI